MQYVICVQKKRPRGEKNERKKNTNRKVNPLVLVSVTREGGGSRQRGL